MTQHTIESLRREISELDRFILELILKRFGFVEQIAKLKEDQELPTYDPEREKQLLQKIEQIALKLKDSEFATAAKEIFSQIMASSRALQDLKRGDKSHHFDPFGKYYCLKCEWNTPGIPGPPGSTHPTCSACHRFLVPQEAKPTSH